MTRHAPPQELRERVQWVGWRLINGQKIPIDAKTGKYASTADPETWSTYEQACKAYKASQRTKKPYAGIGYVFSKDDPYVGIDLDDCRDEGTGEITLWAQTIINTMGTLSEVSPSGTGIKMWVKGTIDDSLTESIEQGAIEIYSWGRYFTYTGMHLDGTPEAIRDASTELTALCEKLRPTPEPQPEVTSKLPDVADDDDYVRRWCLAALYGEQAKVKDAVKGQRHNRRRDSARALGGLIHTGGLTEQEITDALAVNFGDNEEVAREAIAAGIAYGKDKPRQIPAQRYTVQQIAGQDDDLENLTPDQLKQRLRSAIAERDYYHDQAEHLDQWRDWTIKVAALPTESVSPAAKVVAMALWPEMKSRESRGITEPQAVYIEKDRERAGLSADTYGSKLKELDKAGAVVYELRKVAPGKSRVLIQPAAFFDPQTWAPAEPRDHGGHHPKKERPVQACPACGPDAPVLEEVTVIRTAICGTCETMLDNLPPKQGRRMLWQPDQQIAGQEPGDGGGQDAVLVKTDATLVPQVAGQVNYEPDDLWDTQEIVAVIGTQDELPPVPIIIEDAPDLTTAIQRADAFCPPEGKARNDYKTAQNWLYRGEVEKARTLADGIDEPLARQCLLRLAAWPMPQAVTA